VIQSRYSPDIVTGDREMICFSVRTAPTGIATQRPYLDVELRMLDYFHDRLSQRQ
jgi:hypothetical protein